MNLKKNVIIILTLLPKGVQNKLWKLFWLKIFLPLPPVSKTPVVHLELGISRQNFEKIWNGPNGIIRGLGETDPCRKPEVENLVALSLSYIFALRLDQMERGATSGRTRSWTRGTRSTTGTTWSSTRRDTRYIHTSQDLPTATLELQRRPTVFPLRDTALAGFQTVGQDNGGKLSY